MWMNITRRRRPPPAPEVGPTLPSLLVQSLVPLTLQRDQREVDALPLQQLVVFALLHSSAVLEADDDVGVLYGGQPVGDGDGGATQAYLWRNQNARPGIKTTGLLCFTPCGDLFHNQWGNPSRWGIEYHPLQKTKKIPGN